jgi:hypothetical protein
VLSSLASVDLVVLFPDDTPLTLIEAIRPDVLVKDADYSSDQVVGADTVERNGGKLLLVDLLAGEGDDGDDRAGQVERGAPRGESRCCLYARLRFQQAPECRHFWETAACRFSKQRSR